MKCDRIWSAKEGAIESWGNAPKCLTLHFLPMENENSLAAMGMFKILAIGPPNNFHSTPPEFSRSPWDLKASAFHREYSL